MESILYVAKFSRVTLTFANMDNGEKASSFYSYRSSEADIISLEIPPAKADRFPRGSLIFVAIKRMMVLHGNKNWST